MKVITHANFHSHHSYIADDGKVIFLEGERNSMPSMTIPDGALSLKEMLTRYVRGEDVQQFPPMYDEDVYPGLEHMSKLDRLDLLSQVKDEVKTIRTRISKPRKVAADSPIKPPPVEST